MKISLKYCSLIIFVFMVNACSKTAVEFSGENAFAYLETQCSFGPRNPGSDGYLKCKNYLMEELSKYADTVWTQSFSGIDLFSGNEYALDNIIGQFNPHAAKHILLGAHWDTRPRADQETERDKVNQPIPGANDGASGVAVLLELAKMFKSKMPLVTVTMVFFDGEDLGISGVNNSYAMGAQFFAHHLPVSKPDYAIVIDMVGDANLHLPIERHSYRFAPELTKQIWKQAQDLKLQAFDQSIKYMVYDDHVPLYEKAGIPAIDIIDFDYPHELANYWHTMQDTPDKCAAGSLDQVGTLLANHIYGFE